MRVRIEYTVDVDDAFRRALNLHYGDVGLADRRRVRQWFERNGDSASLDLMYQLAEHERTEDGD